jgi:CHRD domain
MHARIIPFVAFALAAFLTTNSSAYAQTLKFQAKIDAAQEVPTNDSKGNGTADLMYDTTSKNLTWTITFDGLTGPATVAHFHGPAEPGKTAGVALLIGQKPTSPVKGSATLTDAQAADLMAGRWYVNVHTEANKAGEIRGQVTK